MAGRPKAFDPDVALERAMNLFWRQGYEATGLQALLDAMQIGRQSLYDTFGGKRALYQQALLRYDRWRLGQVRHILEQPGSPLGNVRGLIEMWGAMASSQPFKGCLVHNTVVELGQHDAEWAEAARAHFLTLEALILDALQRARAEGEVPPTMDLPRRARGVIVTFLALLALGKANMDAAFIQDVVDEALTLLTPAV